MTKAKSDVMGTPDLTMNHSDSMAEDELLNIGEILLRYRNYLYEDDREILGGMLSAKEAEQAINTYNTNKIILEDLIDEWGKSWKAYLELEASKRILKPE